MEINRHWYVPQIKVSRSNIVNVHFLLLTEAQQRHVA